MKSKNFNLIIAVAVIFASVVMTSCGGSKSLSRKSATGFGDIEKDACQQKAEEKPAIRSYGVGSHFREMTARNIAETQARAQFARALEASIKAGTRSDTNTNVAYDGDMAGANIVEQQNAGDNDWAQSIAEQEIRNTTVISTCPKFNPTTKQYQVSVCVEYNEGVSVLADNITKKVQKLSKDRKLEMNFEFEQFRKNIEAELEKKRNSQSN